MTLGKTVWIQAGEDDDPIQQSAKDYRTVIDALVPGEGVCGLDHFKVRQRGGGANFTVDVGGLVPRDLAVIAGDTSTNQGKYVQDNVATLNVGPFPAAPASGTKYHLVYLQVRDKQAGGGAASYDPLLDILPDLGAGLRAAPTTAIRLAQVAISKGQTSILNAHITDLRPQAQPLGFNVFNQDRVSGGTTDAQGFIWLPHTLGRKVHGAVATFNGPNATSGGQATHVTMDVDGSTETQIRARVWQPAPYYVWPNKAVKISYRVW